MDNYFKTNLKHLRITNGLTQEDLGKKLGKDYSTIGKWENGTRSPIMEDVLRVADLFQIDLKELLLTDLKTGTSITTSNNDKKYKEILKKKGLMDDNDYINEENLDKLLKIADMIEGLNKKED